MQTVKDLLSTKQADKATGDQAMDNLHTAVCLWDTAVFIGNTDKIAQRKQQVIDCAAELLEASNALSQRIAQLESALRGFVDNINPVCTCHEAYTSRNRRDPSCEACEWRDELAAARVVLGSAENNHD